MRGWVGFAIPLVIVGGLWLFARWAWGNLTPLPRESGRHDDPSSPPVSADGTRWWDGEKWRPVGSLDEPESSPGGD